MPPSLISIHNLRKSFGSFEAVRGISLSLQPGEIFGLLGPNGAGKTTTIGMIAGLVPPSGGEICIGENAGSAAGAEARRLIGIVPQELAIYGKLTGRENLRFFGSLFGLRGSKLAARVDAMLELVGLTDRAGSLAETYSGGMKRRLNLAAGLMHDPQLLLLDEPTVGVDPQSRNHIFEGVKALNRQGLTVLYTSHYMEEVEALCDRVGIMENGRLIACDTLSGLVAGLGGALIEVGLGHADAPTSDLLARLRAVERVLEVDAIGVGDEGDRHIALHIRAERADLALPAIVDAFWRAGVPFHRLSIKQPDLEDVFLSLTGKTLRD